MIELGGRRWRTAAVARHGARADAAEKPVLTGLNAEQSEVLQCCLLCGGAFLVFGENWVQVRGSRWAASRSAASW